MQDELKQVPGAPGVYARPDGEIFSMKRSGRLRPLTKTSRGPTAQVKVQSFLGRCRRSPSVGSLVLRAFVGPPPTPKHRALHLDCDSRNDALSNLRWATPREIHQHRTLFALDSFEGTGALSDLATIARRLREGEDRLVIGREFKVSPGSLNWLMSLVAALAFQRRKTRAA